MTEHIEALKAAREHLADVRKNPDHWRVSVPVQETDSDMIITRALNSLEELIEENTALETDFESKYAMPSQDAHVDTGHGATN